MKIRGFTLIELLAVIIILAVIALIATPIVMNIIQRSKNNAKIREYEMIEHAASMYIMGEKNGNIGDKLIVSIEELQDKGYLSTNYTNEFVLVNNKKEYYYTERRTLEKNYVDVSAMEFLVKKLYGVEIGDYINYDSNETYSYTSLGGQTFSAAQNLKWQVLGLDSEGRLEIISETTIGQSSGGELVGSKRYYKLSGETGYINGVDELNKISELFVHGNYAVSARSVNLNDLKVLSIDFRKKYDKEFDSNTGEFGTKTTLTKNGSTISFSCSNGSAATGDINDFYYFDISSNEFIQSAEDDKNYVVNNTYMAYYPKTVLGVTEAQLPNLGIGWVNLLYVNANCKGCGDRGHSYWLATKRDYANPNGYNSYGMLYVDAMGINGKTFTKKKNSTVQESEYSFGIRPVITLDSNISLGINSGSYDIYEKVETDKLCNRVSTATTGTVPDGTFRYGDEYICNVDYTNSKHFFIIEKTTNEVSLIMDRNIINNIKWCLSGTNNSCNADGALSALSKGTGTWLNIDSKQISLPTAAQITAANGGTNYPISKVWLYNYLKTSTNSVNINGYWLQNKTSSNSAQAWSLYGGGTTRYLSSGTPVDNTNYGVRPVITINKNNLN